MKLSPEEKKFLIERIAAGDDLPDDFQEKLFPTEQKEYELRYGGKMRREDVLADQDGSFAVPLQIERTFNGERELFDDGWRNMIVFGDNLHFLKTCYADKDELIKGKVKGKVKLIYIDPPFGTASDFDSKSGNTAYTDRAKNSDFVEFLRRRLILAKELLSPEGSIYVHLDYKKAHYIKVILDEIFKEINFRNEIIVKRTQKNFIENDYIKSLNTATDSVFVYANSESTRFKPVYREERKEETWHSLDAPNWSNSRPNLIYEIFGQLPPDGRCWSWNKERSDKAIVDGKLRPNPNTGKPEYLIPERVKVICTSLWEDITAYSFGNDYPTEKKESLLQRIIEMSTNENDLVLDFFGGSGTTAAVAEKLGRKWITCDIGKFSFYTMQKRLLTIQSSKSLTQSNKKYGKQSKIFLTVNTGIYNIEKLNSLTQEKYTKFVLDLFEVEPQQKTIGGIKIHGERKDGYDVIVWDLWQDANAKITEEYLEQLHSIIGKKKSTRFYLIAPANAVSFVGDYHEIDDVRYYFLKIPYQIINELHREPFARARQPRSKTHINDLDNAIGFHFMRQPDVECRFANDELIISKFKARESNGTKEFENFGALAMLLVDENFNGKDFTMTNFYFAEDLKSNEAKEIVVQLKVKSEKIVVVFVDLFGNEFKQEIKIN